MGRHGWIAHTIARMLDLIRFRAARIVAAVPGRLPGRSEASAGPVSLTSGADSPNQAGTQSPVEAPDPPAGFPGSERFAAPVAVEEPVDAPRMDRSPGDGAPEERVDEPAATAAAGWSDDELLTFTPDASLDLVDEIEFSFVPEASLGETIPEGGLDSGDGGIGAMVTGADPGLGWVEGDGTRDCPDAYPIKGNGSSHIYHLPGQPSYAATIAELCFATEAAAVAEGYRPVRRPQGAE